VKTELAKSAGFCFGVKRAIDRVYTLTEKNAGKKVYTLGPIIHNEQVVQDLEQRGVSVVNHPSELESGGEEVLVIRSHGVAKTVIEELQRKKIIYEDATCPFVKKIHQTVQEYAEKGYDIVIIGSASHPEVQGILGWADGAGTVIETPQEAEAFELENVKKKLCVVAQTTFNYKKFKELVEIISKKGYDILAVNTICNATSTRQEEAEELAARSDAMLVIGGTHSSNSRKLYEICKNQCENTFFIQTVDDLRAISLDSFTSLGITAGASTPNNIIQEVLKACQKI
jgi:4-hydroxy-3-methylbut-2-enyl diphosphate reductase